MEILSCEKLHFSYWVVSFFVRSLWDRCGSLWLVVARGLLWVVEGRSGFQYLRGIYTLL